MNYEKIEQLNKLFNDNDVAIEIDDYYQNDLEDVSTFDELEDFLINNTMLDAEIIYYSRAIAYLKEHDPSLRESLEIATEMGYTVENINSELLASLHVTQRIRDKFYSLENEITEILE